MAESTGTWTGFGRTGRPVTGRRRKFHNDEQILKPHQLRRWPADRLRTCRPQPLINPDAGPLVAIHERLISRKGMGGMMTDLNSRIMADNNTPVPGLYAAGEAAAAIHNNP